MFPITVSAFVCFYTVPVLIGRLSVKYELKSKSNYKHNNVDNVDELT